MIRYSKTIIGRRILSIVENKSSKFERMSSKSNIADCSNSAALVAPQEEIVRFITDCMVKVGVSREDGKAIGEHLFTADYRGHFSHGMNRLEMYIQDVEKGLTSADSKPELVNDFKAVALVEGNNGFGHVIGKYCMNLAMSKAKEYGIGMVSCRGSNHYGIAGYYALLAMRENLIGFSCTNTSPLLAPTRSRVAALGTNPISFGTNAANGDEFVLDMATTCVALGKIELAIRKGDRIPDAWALGEGGKPTTDPEDAFKAARLLPLGGQEQNSGYKGYGLALMVEILCGILSGSNFGPNIRHWMGSESIANLGHCFMAIDPEKFAPGSGERISILLEQLRNLPTIDDRFPVLVPGDPERNHMKKVDRHGGITYHPNQINATKKLAEKLAVKPIEFIERLTND